MFHFDKNFGLFVGILTTNEFHKHYALQISVSVDSEMEITQKGELETLGDSFCIPSKIEHKLISEDTQLTILINPLSPLGHYLQLKHDKSNITPLDTELSKRLKTTLTNFKMNQIRFEEFCLLITNHLTEYKCSCEVENHSGDDRIIKALEFFEENFDNVYRLEEIAEITYLSPSRFLHLFKDKTGLSFRRYQLWNKIIKSLPHLAKKSITNTAHTFGFTDSSHYTRTFKETFGVTPKFMFLKE